MIKVVCLESGDFSTMIKNENNIPVGYKDSTVGVIPQEWEVKKVKSICNIDANSLSSKTSPDYEFDYISLSDVDNDSFEVIKSHQLFKTAPSRARRIVKRNDVVISTVRPNLQGFFMIKNDVEDLIVSTGFSVLSPIKCNPYYLLAYFFSEAITKQFYSLVVGSNYPAVNSSDIANLKIACPTLIEQQKIVEILRTWDEAIEKQTKLIKALEKRKQALMQRLLSGRTRLPGFTGEWKKEKLMDIGIFLSTNNFPRDKMNETEGTIMNVHYGDILIKYPTIVDLKTINVPYLNNGIKVKSDLLKDGDVIIADTAEDKIVGKAIEIVNIGTHQIVSGLHTFAFRPNESLFVNRFLGYYLNSVGYRKQLESLIQGIKVCSISKSSILNTSISIPLIKEQQAIVNILVSADDEIKRHNTKLSQLRKQKQGLIQQLLTGKKRVK